MDRVGLAMGRVLFFVMLFISTACNKIDRSVSANDFAVPQQASLTASEERVRELDARVRQLEGQLQAMNRRNAELAEIPGGANWD